MSRDGKDRFYRNLNLDEDTKKILKWYRKTKKDLDNNKVQDKNESS